MLRDMSTLGERLTALLDGYNEQARRAGAQTITGADVNEAIGKRRGSGYFSRLSNDKRANPSRADLRKIADFFGVDVATLTDAAPFALRVRDLVGADSGQRRPTSYDAIDAAVAYLPRGCFTPEVVQGFRGDARRKGLDPNLLSPSVIVMGLADLQAERIEAALQELKNESFRRVVHDTAELARAHDAGDAKRIVEQTTRMVRNMFVELDATASLSPSEREQRKIGFATAMKRNLFAELDADGMLTREQREQRRIDFNIAMQTLMDRPVEGSRARANEATPEQRAAVVEEYQAAARAVRESAAKPVEARREPRKKAG